MPRSATDLPSWREELVRVVYCVRQLEAFVCQTSERATRHGRAIARFDTGVVEGLNTRVKLVTRNAYGYRRAATIKIALFHILGRLPDPEIVHRFA